MPAASASPAAKVSGSELMRARSSVLEAPLEMDEEQRDRRRGHSGNARGLPDGLRAMLIELLLDFDRQAPHRAVVEIRRERLRLLVGPAGDLLALPGDVS